jgi:hypothetical protein
VVGAPGSRSGGGDVGPTAQQVAVNAGFKQEVPAEYKKILAGGAQTFVKLLKRVGVATEIVP